ncbi:MAG: dynamin family protein [Pseudoclavibacter sp.]|nr:dynamin family protein [Pseudoclavibacter sp.]
MNEQDTTAIERGGPDGGDPIGRLAELRRALAETRLPLDLADAQQARDEQAAALRQIDDYIAPRLADLDAPLLTVVGGSTGAGKSTLVNSLVGFPVTRTGAIRPTTRQPILLHAPQDRDAFSSERVLPGLARITGVRHDAPVPSSRAGDTPDAALAASLVLVGEERMPPHLAILDAPDVDSISDENRAMAAQLLAAADLWLFVTTANRYADAVPWRLLEDAAGRDITVGVVLNRVPPDAMGEVEGDLRELLAGKGLAQAPLFVVPETALDEYGMLPGALVAPVREWLHGLAADRGARQELARRTVTGAVARVVERTRGLAAARQAQSDTAAGVRDAVRDIYDDAAELVVDAVRDGSLLRGEVLARWQDYVGTSDVFRRLESWYGRARDTVVSWMRGRPAPIREVEQEIESGLHAVVVDQAGRAAGHAYTRLRTSPAGRQLAADPALGRESPELSERAGEMIRSWQTGLVEMIHAQAAGKRMRARIMSLGLNVVTVALMIVVFASTGGLTGGEVAIAGGSAVVGQKLLETIFGEDAVRRLARRAREDLDGRVRALFDREYERYGRLLQLVEAGTSPAELTRAAQRLADSLRAPAGPEAAA